MKLYRAVSMVVLGVMFAGGAAHAQERNRDELEARLRALRGELRELERQLGRGLRSEFRLRGGEGIPRVLTFMSNRARLGVAIRTEANDETDAVGAVLSSVSPGSPAEEAGLEPGDIIVSIDGQRLTDAAAERERGESAPAQRLIELIRDHDAGDEVTIEYRRNGQTASTIATLREMDDMNDFAFGFNTDENFNWNPQINIPEMSRFEVGGPNGFIAIFGGPWSDIELVSLNESLGRYFGTDQGLLVVKAPDEESMQLQSGDVILSIDGREARTPSRAMRIFRSYEAGESFDLEVMRDQQRMTMTVTVPEREDRFDRLERREYRRRF